MLIFLRIFGHFLTATNCPPTLDCELLGSSKCAVGGSSRATCVCNPGFTGETCGQLRLKPILTIDGAKTWPIGSGTASWGFSATHGPTAGNYLAVVNVGCGDTATHVTGTFVGLLVSWTAHPRSPPAPPCTFAPDHPNRT